MFGASGGIGSALSQRLLFGRYGSPAALVLAADHKDKLQQLQQQLQERSSGETKLEVITADATDHDAVSAVSFSICGPECPRASLEQKRLQHSQKQEEEAVLI